MSEQEAIENQDQADIADQIIEAMDSYTSTKDVDARNAIWEGLTEEQREGMAELGYQGPRDLDTEAELENFTPIRPGSPAFARADSEARLDVAAALKRFRRGEVEVSPELRDEIETLHAESSVLPPEQGSELIQRAARLVRRLDEGAGRSPERVALAEEVENADGSVTRTERSRSGVILSQETISAEEIEAAMEADARRQSGEDDLRPWGDRPYEVTLSDVQSWSPEAWAAFESEFPLYADYVSDENGQASGVDFQRWKAGRRSRREAMGWR